MNTTESKTSTSGLPLHGIRVVEIGTSVAAPYATWILAALGADVIKVERPDGGDDARQWGEIFADGSSSLFQALNRDKRSVAVDLKNAEACARLRQFLVDKADVVLQNLRPGLIAKYGLAAEDLTTANERLIYCNIWAFGANGPLKHKPGYDPLMQAYGGLMSVTGEMGHAPVRVGTSIIDMGTGMWCAIGILAALQQRERSGKGCIVDTSLFETALGWMTYHATGLQASGVSPIRRGSGAPGMVPYQVYPCSDGYLMVAAPNDKLFALLTTVLGREDLPQDARFNSNQQRYKNLDALNAIIAPIMQQQPRSYWQEKLDAVGVPNAPEQNTAEMMADAQTQALGILQQLPENKNTLQLMGLPVSFNGARPPLRSLAPGLGEHNDEFSDEGFG